MVQVACRTMQPWLHLGTVMHLIDIAGVFIVIGIPAACSSRRRRRPQPAPDQGRRNYILKRRPPG
jgi:hypothetical protein